MISSERSLTNEGHALDAGACAFLHKPFNSLDVDRMLHAAFGLRSPNLKVKSSSPNFDVAIEGSTIRLARRFSGHIFEYLRCEKPPYLRNGVVRSAAPSPRRNSLRCRKRRRYCNCDRRGCSLPRNR
jgi:hypothetical protein